MLAPEAARKEIASISDPAIMTTKQAAAKRSKAPRRSTNGVKEPAEPTVVEAAIPAIAAPNTGPRRRSAPAASPAVIHTWLRAKLILGRVVMPRKPKPGLMTMPAAAMAKDSPAVVVHIPPAGTSLPIP